MSTLSDILCNNDKDSLNAVRKTTLKPVIGRLLMVNLIERLKHNNLLFETQGDWVIKVKLDKRGLHQWVRPYVHNNRLLFEVISKNWFTMGVRIEASDIFGNGINQIVLPRY